MSSKIFRKVSLQRLSSPEQLDQVIQVTKPRGWIALATMGGVLGMVMLWGFFGNIPTKVQGRGILIKSGGVFEVVTVGAGQVSDMAVDVGDEVSEGQVIARIAQPQLREEIQHTKSNLRELQVQYNRVQRFGDLDRQVQKTSFAQQRGNLEQSIRIAEEQSRWLDEKIESQQRLLTEGLITKQTLLNTQQELYRTREAIEEDRNQLTQLEARELAHVNETEQDLQTWRFRISEAERDIVQMEEEYDLLSKVVSPYTGQVLELLVEPGNLIQAGASVVRLDLVGRAIKDLEAVIYVSSMDGKRIRSGMPIQIAPTTVKQEEFGFILGDVTYVSDFPATTEGMMRVLKNQQLVQALSGGNAPFEIYADLRVDPSSTSGFRWSSSTGPPMAIQTGTVCTASITVEERRPIELMLPVLRKLAGV